MKALVTGSAGFIGQNAVLTNDRYPPTGKAELKAPVVDDDVIIRANVMILPGSDWGEDLQLPRRQLSQRISTTVSLRLAPRHGLNPCHWRWCGRNLFLYRNCLHTPDMV